MQYDTTVNRWHTSKNTARINASNPCSEYMFLDDSACNLASLNLLKFAPNGTFDVEAYRHAVDVLITAQEILVDNAGYPTESVNSPCRMAARQASTAARAAASVVMHVTRCMTAAARILPSSAAAPFLGDGGGHSRTRFRRQWPSPGSTPGRRHVLAGQSV